MVATTVLAKVAAKADKERMLRAIQGLASGAYTVTVVVQDEEKVSGTVANGDGKTYAVVLTGWQTYCSCKDAVYRSAICKHAVALALYAASNPKEEPQEGEHRPNLRLARVKTTEELEREGFYC